MPFPSLSRLRGHLPHERIEQDVEATGDWYCKRPTLSLPAKQVGKLTIVLAVYYCQSSW